MISAFGVAKRLAFNGCYALIEAMPIEAIGSDADVQRVGRTSPTGPRKARPRERLRRHSPSALAPCSCFVFLVPLPTWRLRWTTDLTNYDAKSELYAWKCWTWRRPPATRSGKTRIARSQPVRRWR